MRARHKHTKVCTLPQNGHELARCYAGLAPSGGVFSRHTPHDLEWKPKGLENGDRFQACGPSSGVKLLQSGALVFAPL